MDGAGGGGEEEVDEDVGGRGALIADGQKDEGALVSPPSVSPVATCRPLKSLKIQNFSSVRPHRF